MPLVTFFTRDSGVRRAAREAAHADWAIATARSWERLGWLVRERPVTVVVLDSDAFGSDLAEEQAAADLRRRFPSLATVFVARPQLDPLALFRLGRAGIRGLVLLPLDGLATGLERATRRALGHGTVALVARSVNRYLPAREARALRLALEGAQLGWGAEELARRAGLTRPHLSVRLKATGLPSTGHLLVWAKLLHAGRWLADPGRSAESVSRQLDYSSGAAFRRALRNYVGMKPTEVRAAGGLGPVLERFLDDCELERPGGRSAA